jgi:hypothetical protein
MATPAVKQAVQLLRARLAELDREREIAGALRSRESIAADASTSSETTHERERGTSIREFVRLIMDQEPRAWTPLELFEELDRTGNVDPHQDPERVKRAIRNAVFYLRQTNVLRSAPEKRGASIAVKWQTTPDDAAAEPQSEAAH